jgi:hypothetical protein
MRSTSRFLGSALQGDETAQAQGPQRQLMKEQGPNKWTLIRSPTWSGRDPQEKFLPFTFRPDAGPTIRTLALRLVLHYESALRHTLPLRNSANLAPPLSLLREQTLSLLPFKVCVNDKLLSSFFWQASLAQAIEIMLRVLGDHEGCEGPCSPINRVLTVDPQNLGHLFASFVFLPHCGTMANAKTNWR